MYTLVDGVEFYDKDEVDDIVRAITGGSLPNEDGIRNELTTKIEAEATAREQADTALGTRIDEEVAAREAAAAANKSLIDTETQARAAVDTLLSNQLAAIEQLHTTLIGPNGFVDSDGDTVKANDSGKSIRQIAHEEFYRQLITDADNVKTQLDTLKELADYLQQNPSIITDMYSKLGITWSIDNPTDFGTFDFSRVLAATNVDDAVLELYNTFTDKIGDLTQLTTTFKDSIVGAVNELDADIGNEVTARTDADTALGTRIDNEVTAREQADTALGARIDDEVTVREQADTALGTRIDTEIGTLSALTTTAKDSIVGAVNELDADIGSEVTARTDADTTLGTRIDGEVTAREQADTALGTRIDTEVGTLSALTTTAKDNVVAAINEVNGKVGTGGGGGDGAGVAQLETKLNEEITARGQADTALGTRIDTEVGTLSALTTTAKDNVVAAINEVNGKVGAGGDTGSTATNCEQFTFVVDSNEKLAAWANATGGNDYTSVLVKKGEWTSTTGVNLTTAGTKVVVGAPGSKLVFNNVEKGLYYATAPTEPDYYMRCVTVKTTRTDDNASTSTGFHSCLNLYNCISTSTSTSSAGGSIGTGFHSCSNLYSCTGTSSSEGYNQGSGYGFHSCSNLYNCTGTGGSTDHGRYGGVGCGFHSCENLSGCTGSGACTGDIAAAGYGFSECSMLSNCTGTTGTVSGGTSTNHYSFHNCSSLSGCTGTINTGNSTSVIINCYAFSGCSSLSGCTSDIETSTVDGASNNAYGFNMCSNLSSCIATVKGISGGDMQNGGGLIIDIGFATCKNLTNCTGTANGERPSGGTGTRDSGFYNCENLSGCTGTGNGTEQGYGFDTCKTVIGCRAGGHCTTNVFKDCYASNSETSTYACADTANGGFNNVTNPAA